MCVEIDAQLCSGTVHLVDVLPKQLDVSGGLLYLGTHRLAQVVERLVGDGEQGDVDVAIIAEHEIARAVPFALQLHRLPLTSVGYVDFLCRQVIGFAIYSLATHEADGQRARRLGIDASTYIEGILYLSVAIARDLHAVLAYSCGWLDILLVGTGLADDGVGLGDAAVLDMQHVSTLVVVDAHSVITTHGGCAVHHHWQTVGIHPELSILGIIDSPAIDELVAAYHGEELAVVQIVVILRHLVRGLCEAGGELILQHLYLGIDALACSTKDEITRSVEVLKKLSEA